MISTKEAELVSQNSFNPELKEKLLGLEDYLAENIIGQREVIPPISEALQDGELGLTDPERPKASFLFLGPTGVGKTEITLLFTNYLFGDSEKVIRLDMSEFQTQDSLNVLLGRNIEEAGMLGMHYDRVSGHGTLLFDEIEKAHPRVLDIFLQVMDAGRITLRNHRTLDLSQFYVVCTSNIAAQALMQARSSNRATLVRFVEQQAQMELRPEIFARIHSTLVFNKLDYNAQLKIAGLMLKKELKRQKSQGYDMEAGEDVLPLIIKFGYHPRLGARPMRKAVESLVRRALRKDLLTGTGSGCGLLVNSGDSLRLINN